MKSTEKNNRNQKTSNLPLSIGAGARFGLKIGAIAVGFCLFGSGFIWVVLALFFCSNLLRGYLILFALFRGADRLFFLSLVFNLLIL